MRKCVAAAILLLFASVTLTAWDNLNLSLQQEMATIQRAKAPMLNYRTVLFTFDRSRDARYVGIAFGFEDFQTIHPYKQNEHGVFVLPYEVPEGTTVYRIVVDGLWMADPTNPNRAHDQTGNVLSILELQLPPRRLYRSPRLSPAGEVVFVLNHEPGKRIYLSGDFNNWEPFMFVLTEESPGLYVYQQRFPPGEYEYCFIADGARLLDPLNPSFGTDSSGYLASRFAVR
jgi:hypothetical protein